MEIRYEDFTLEDYQARIAELQADPGLEPDKRRVLAELLEYGDSLLG